MNKSLITNLISLVLLAVGYTTQNQFALYAGLFAFSGAITNWLAIHMLFEKVPGLYMWVGGKPLDVSEADSPAHHTPEFFVDDSGMKLGVRLLTNLTLDYMAVN